MFYVVLIFAFFAFVTVLRTVRIVPQQTAFVVERLGKYHRTLYAGLHIVVPFIDTVQYKHNLKEIVLDIPEQVCITKDNVQVGIDGVIFFRVIEPQKASYGVSSFSMAIIQLAQTTLRSEIGKIDLGRTVEERMHINNGVVSALDQATDAWGVKVLRYEIKTIRPPVHIATAMEKQKSADVEKRAKILESEGDRDSKINRAEGIKQEMIKNSEAEKQKRINEAEGNAQAISLVAEATANGLRQVAAVLAAPGGDEAARLRVAEGFVQQFGALAKVGNTMIIPANTADLAGMVATAMNVFGQGKLPVTTAPVK